MGKNMGLLWTRYFQAGFWFEIHCTPLWVFPYFPTSWSKYHIVEYHGFQKVFLLSESKVKSFKLWNLWRKKQKLTSVSYSSISSIDSLIRVLIQRMIFVAITCIVPNLENRLSYNFTKHFYREISKYLLRYWWHWKLSLGYIKIM